MGRVGSSSSSAAGWFLPKSWLLKYTGSCKPGCLYLFFNSESRRIDEENGRALLVDGRIILEQHSHPSAPLLIVWPTDGHMCDKWSIAGVRSGRRGLGRVVRGIRARNDGDFRYVVEML